ncbi:hypothetical protein BC835DRAFT_242922 [Cytidiella melzeri]|nr:hypothetical protein BC835DRAFT_242922 [Cytidiella melzeri]
MAFGHHDNTTTDANAQPAAGPLGTGAGPEMNAAVEDNYETRSHPTTQAGPGAYYQHGVTHFPPQQQGGDLHDPGHSTTGKIERIIGTVLHNEKLKQKGIEKEAQAHEHAQHGEQG